jgi:hypothetical protein
MKFHSTHLTRSTNQSGGQMEKQDVRFSEVVHQDNALSIFVSIIHYKLVYQVLLLYIFMKSIPRG